MMVRAMRPFAARRPLELTHDGVPEAIAMRHVEPLAGGADLQTGLFAE